MFGNDSGCPRENCLDDDGCCDDDEDDDDNDVEPRDRCPCEIALE